jgi:hypothetical protein
VLVLTLSPRRRAAVLLFLLLVLIEFHVLPAFAGVTGSISGRLVDSTGALVPNASVSLVSVETNSQLTAITASDGEYHFLALPVGHYRLKVTAAGFSPFEENDIAIDANDALRIDIALRVAAAASTVEVEANSLHVETTSNQIGNVIGSATLLALPLDGRSYTDLLGLQAGVAPASAATVTIGFIPGLNVGTQQVGNLSINGARENANGFVVNGGRVEDPFTNGTSVLPNLDSIQEFRLLTSNFDAEYGYFGGGLINVVTKAGTNDLHGGAFFFARNQNLDANNFFNTSRGEFAQYQPGATLGGPIKRDKLFFFSDYQGTFANIGASTGLVAVPTTAQRNGSFDPASLTGSVNGGYWANILSQRLGTVVTAGEKYADLFPSGTIPQAAWSAPSKKILPLYPEPNAQGFFSGTDATTNKDNRGGVRGDLIGHRLGTLSAYYFIDRIITSNAFGGDEVPGWPAGTVGRNQQANLGDTRTFGSNAVNEARINYSRYVDIYAAPQGTSKTAADYGINGYAVTGAQGLPHIGVTGLSGLIGLPAATFYTTSNTYEGLENFSKVIGSHSLKFGGEFGWVQWNSDYVPSGGFTFNGNETGNGVADFLLGAPVLVRQPSPEFDIANTRFGGVYGQDSWRARPNLTLNLGLRWQVGLPWYEQHNRFATVVPGQQSIIFPTAPLGLVYPGDPGIGRGISPTRWKNFAPRVGLAYTPTPKLSVRASFGIFYTTDDSFSSFFAGSPAPYQIFYVSPSPNLLDYPYTNRATGVVNHPFPFSYPQNGDKNIDFSQFLPLGGYPFTATNNSSPYSEVYSLSIQQQLSSRDVLSLNYAGSSSHHLLTNEEFNPGDPALCLGLSQISEVAPGTQTCGPSGEDSTYTRADGTVVKSTRPYLGAEGFASTPIIRSIGYSNYNSLQVSLNHTSRLATFLAAYTWSKSLDNSSSISDQGVNPFNPAFTYGLSSFDVSHNFVVSYNIRLPFADLFQGRWARVTGGWELTGITRLSTGFPVDVTESDDRSLLGVGGVINGSFDVPNYTPGDLHLGHRPPSGQPYFNTSLFSEDVLGKLGNANRRFFHGPGLVNFDTALVKNTHLTERITLQFRGEFFNVFNHPQFNNPGGNINSGSTFGVITSAGNPRIGQLALKANF